MNQYSFIIDKCNRRSFYLYQLLSNDGLNVYEYGKENVDEGKTAVYIFPPSRLLSENECDKLQDGSIVFCGATEYSKQAVRGLTFYNLMRDNAYCVINSAITAEAALCIAKGATDSALFDSGVLVLGYGRLGKATAWLFAACRARIGVASYDLNEFQAASTHYDTYLGEAFFGALQNYSIVINTIPSRIITAEKLNCFADGTLLLELASAPHCLDSAILHGSTINYVKAAALPDKYSPRSAAISLRRCIFDKLKREGTTVT